MTRLDQLGCVTAAFPSPEELTNIYIGDVGTIMPAATTRVTRPVEYISLSALDRPAGYGGAGSAPQPDCRDRPWGGGPRLLFSRDHRAIASLFRTWSSGCSMSISSPKNLFLFNSPVAPSTFWLRPARLQERWQMQTPRIDNRS